MSLHVGYVLKVYPRFSETFILNEILELERRGVRVTVFSLHAPIEGRFQPKLASVGADVVYPPTRSAHELVLRIAERRTCLAPVRHRLGAYFWEQIEGDGPLSLAYVSKAIDVAEEAAARGIQHLHAHFATSATAVARMASQLGGVPYSFTAHAKDIYLDTHSPERLRRFIADAAFVVTVCDANRLHLERLTGGRGNLQRIYNGLDLDEFRPAPVARPERFTILGVGRLVPKKGFDTLIDACALLRDRGVGRRRQVHRGVGRGARITLRCGPSAAGREEGADKRDPARAGAAAGEHGPFVARAPRCRRTDRRWSLRAAGAVCDYCFFR